MSVLLSGVLTETREVPWVLLNGWILFKRVGIVGLNSVRDFVHCLRAGCVVTMRLFIREGNAGVQASTIAHLETLGACPGPDLAATGHGRKDTV